MPLKSYHNIDTLKIIIPVLTGIIPLILKLRTDAQIRALNVITEEIVKINDYAIEFLELYQQLKQERKTATNEQMITLNILGNKIDYHFQYLENKIKYFPYGLFHFPQFLFSIDIFYNETHKLFTQYRDSLRMDTILDGKKEYFNQYHKISHKYYHSEVKNVNYDNMIEHSQELINYLEDHILSKTLLSLKLLAKRDLYDIFKHK